MLKIVKDSIRTSMKLKKEPTVHWKATWQKYSIEDFLRLTRESITFWMLVSGAAVLLVILKAEEKLNVLKLILQLPHVLNSA